MANSLSLHFLFSLFLYLCIAVSLVPLLPINLCVSVCSGILRLWLSVPVSVPVGSFLPVPVSPSPRLPSPDFLCLSLSKSALSSQFLFVLPCPYTHCTCDLFCLVHLYSDIHIYSFCSPVFLCSEHTLYLPLALKPASAPSLLSIGTLGSISL